MEEEKSYHFYTDVTDQQELYDTLQQVLNSPLGYVFIGFSYNPASRQAIPDYSWTSEEIKSLGIQKQYILDLKLNGKDVDKLIYFEPGPLFELKKTISLLLNFRYARFINVSNPAYSLIAKEFVKQEFKSIMNFSRWKQMSQASVYIDVQRGRYIIEKK